MLFILNLLAALAVKHVRMDVEGFSLKQYYIPGE